MNKGTRIHREPHALADRLARHVVPEPNTGCWLWTGAVNRDGYGRLPLARGEIRAHRLSYELSVGPIPSGRMVCHHCDTPACVNPRHLFLGTQEENIRDMIRKGRLRSYPKRVSAEGGLS
jgi:hypothetical protein